MVRNVLSKFGNNLKLELLSGFTIGFCVGMASGALFGGFSALR